MDRNPLAMKLEQFARFSEEDHRTLGLLAKHNIRHAGAREDLIHEGDEPRYVKLVLEGWAIRHKMLEDGRRQIVAFLVPGDLCDLNVFILKSMDHTVGTLTPLKYALLSPETFNRLSQSRPRIMQALLWDSLVSASIQREWTLSMGQRSAFERIAHLLCELFIRLNVVGLVNDDSCTAPFTQHDLAEATGLTPVHVNRTIKELRASGLIEWQGRHLRVPDLAALKEAALFSTNYLHLDREGAHLDANA
jgi:CRP-like cAMP-binding protein